MKATEEQDNSNPYWPCTRYFRDDATCITDAICDDEYLKTGVSLVSISREYYAIMQSDGNLCVYAGVPGKQGKLRWCSQITGEGGEFFAILQRDGNLCIYYGSPQKQGRLLWCTSPKAIQGNVFQLVMEDNGNLCIYDTKYDYDSHKTHMTLVWQA